jgi:hypothetical protein
MALTKKSCSYKANPRQPTSSPNQLPSSRQSRETHRRRGTATPDDLMSEDGSMQRDVIALTAPVDRYRRNFYGDDYTPSFVRKSFDKALRAVLALLVA